MKVLEQDKEYNCGVFAVNFILGINGIQSDTETLEQVMGTTENDGTSHEGIKKAVRYFNLKAVENYDSDIYMLMDFLPAIVNYQFCDTDGCDGHYGVILGKSRLSFIIYNPGIGEIETIKFNDFEKIWYSERYGKRWFLKISEIL